jgi:hypothetical protein
MNCLLQLISLSFNCIVLRLRFSGHRALKTRDATFHNALSNSLHYVKEGNYIKKQKTGREFDFYESTLIISGIFPAMPTLPL